MITNTIELIKIVPDEGKVLTNGETYSKEVYIGKNDSLDNWHEIDETDIPTEEIEQPE